MAKNNYKYKIDTLIDNVMTPTFNPKEYIWVLGSKVLASLVSECNNVYVEAELYTLYGIEVHKGRDYGDEAIMLLRDITKIRHINNIHHVTNLTIN